MARVIITTALKEQILRKFKSESIKIFKLFKTLENQPRKGKVLASVDDIVIKELRYNAFRFYFITDGFRLKFGSEDELSALLIKFVKFSDKKNQQKIIDQLKNALRALGFDRLK